MYYTTDRVFTVAVFIIAAILIRLIPIVLPQDDPRPKE